MKPSEQLIEEIGRLQDSLARTQLMAQVVGVEPDMCQSISAFTVLTVFRNKSPKQAAELVDAIRNGMVLLPMNDPTKPNRRMIGDFCVSVSNMMNTSIDVKLEMSATFNNSDGKTYQIWIEMDYNDIKQHTELVDGVIRIKHAEHYKVAGMKHCTSFAITLLQERALLQIIN